MDLWTSIFGLLALLSAALILGLVCERLRQSPILGYLAAGTLLGPNALGLIPDSEEVGHLAELGVALLLFTIGLEFSWGRLRRLGQAALFGGFAQVLATLGFGFAAALLLGLEFKTAFAVGAIVALSSTACVLRLLVARAEIESIHGSHALGILLVQDIAVVPLVLLVTVLGSGGGPGEIVVDILKTLAGAAALGVGFYVVFNMIVPRIFSLEAMLRNRDLPILLAIVTGFGAAWGSHELGLSPALGAFVAGILLAESPFATQVRADVGSIKTLLVTLFFSSIGMLGDPAWFVAHIPQVAAVVAAIIVGKAVIIWAVLRAFRLGHAHALATGICLGQVGEFSFVLAEVARGNLLDEDLFKLLISATIATLFLTPYLVAGAPAFSHSVHERLARLGLLKGAAAALGDPEAVEAGRSVVVGFGPTGRAVARGLQRAGMGTVTVIDLNPSLVSKAANEEFQAQLGDARHADVLEHVKITSCDVAVVTIPDPATSHAVVSLIRSLAPETHVIARARYHRHVDELIDAAHEVIDEERSVALRLVALARRRLRAAAPPPESD